ncbi:STAS domain-containing protein [Desulfococcaceae bacterium HSG8]|nr:STAS domain-containing protein [Desulfococcaceae bacterium HSG8]
MEIDRKLVKGTVVVSVKGKVDTQVAPDFEKYLIEQVDKNENSLVVNMSELIYIASAGLRAVLAAAKKLRTRQKDIMLVGLQKTVKDVFKIAGFHTFCKILDTEEAALKQI